MPDSYSPSDSDRIRDLEDRLSLLVDFALAHEAWEAKVLTDGGAWVKEMLDEQFERVRSLRVKAMSRRY